MSAILKAEAPFTTTDAELAVALVTAGCKLAPHEADGPATNVYSPSVCRSLFGRWRQNPLTGEQSRSPLLSLSPVKPEEFERAVMRAEQLRIPGVVTYAFVKDAVFQRAIDAHDKMAEAFEIAQKTNSVPILAPLAQMSEEAAVMVVCYARRKNEKDMKALAWVRSPRCALGELKKELVPDEEGLMPPELQAQRSYVATGEGMKLWDLHLPDSERAKEIKGKPFIHPKPKL